jgi:trigger factor
LFQAVEDISSTKKRIRLEIPSDLIEKEIKDYLERLRQQTRIPGFRPGKAPIHLIEKRFGKGVEAEVLEKVIPEFFAKALKEADLKPVTMPVLDEKLEYKRNNPLNLSLTIEVMPKIENLDYSGLKRSDVPVTVEDSEIEDYLKRLQEHKALLEVAEKEIEKNDLVTFDYVDCEIEGEKINPSLKEKVLKMGKEILPMDIEEKLIGKKKGETVEFTNTLDEVFVIKELAGKTVKMRILIREVKQKILPAIDDEFAKDLGFENLPELKEKIKESIYKNKNDHAAKIQKAEVLRQLIESNNFEVPETMLMNELQALMIMSGTSGASEEMKGEENMQGESSIVNLTPNENNQGQKGAVEDQASELREKALRNVRASIIIDAIGQREGVVVTEDEIKDRVNFIADRVSSKSEDIMKLYSSKNGSLEDLKHIIYQEKVLDILLSKATVEKGE